MLMRFIPAGGVPTRCLVAGDPGKPALLLLHGLTLTADVWLRNIDALAADFHVIAPDMLGHGFTRPPDDRPPSRRSWRTCWRWRMPWAWSASPSTAAPMAR
jgi:pimeloyl-ACP methyl ester carboxylesterase